jgi:hypothetical protein
VSAALGHGDARQGHGEGEEEVVRPLGLLTEAVGRRRSGMTKREAASSGVLTGAWPPAAPERRNRVREHRE